MTGIWVIGHRGCGKGQIENTLRAMREGLAAGADGVEFDVQASRDGQVVVIHDYTLERTTNGTGSVAQHTLAELKRLDAGEGEAIPTLQEVVDELKGHRGVLIDIEIKVPNIEQKVLETVRRNNIVAQVILSSFSQSILKAVRSNDREIATGLLYSHPLEDPVQAAVDLGANALHPEYTFVSRALVQECHKEHLLINPWTVDEETDMQRMFDLRVDGIITNRPSRLRKLLE
jgi:glycerophosphoryl diester phosphodiesterase